MFEALRDRFGWFKLVIWEEHEILILFPEYQVILFKYKYFDILIFMQKSIVKFESFRREFEAKE